MIAKITEHLPTPPISGTFESIDFVGFFPGFLLGYAALIEARNFPPEKKKSASFHTSKALLVIDASMVGWIK